jgi:hypothetical protein
MHLQLKIYTLYKLNSKFSHLSLILNGSQFIPFALFGGDFSVFVSNSVSFLFD